MQFETPLVSVLMPVYNTELYVVEATRSILNQTYTNLELIVVDDGCTDSSINKILSLRDSRIKIFRNQENQGLAASLNMAIENSSGEYLARMDGDDISMPYRLEHQIERLNHDRSISVLGTGMRYFNFSTYKNYFPDSHELCKAKLLFNVCFGHPTVVFRRKIFDNPANHYNPELKQYSEDYDLYVRLVDQCRFANLKELSVKYRTFEPAIKSKAENLRKTNSQIVRSRLLAQIGISFSQEQLEIHRKACDTTVAINSSDLNYILEWFCHLYENNLKTHYFENKALQFTLAEQAFLLLYQNPGLQMNLARLQRYPFFKHYRIPIRLRVKNQLKRMLHLIN